MVIHQAAYLALLTLSSVAACGGREGSSNTVDSTPFAGGAEQSSSGGIASTTQLGGATGSSTSSDGTSSSAETGCTGNYETTQIVGGIPLCVAKLVTIAGDEQVAPYGIDATEVTRGQYEAWVATNPALPPSADAACGWKSSESYSANTECMQSTEVRVCQTNCAHPPQVCVDWCDAYYYCAAVGKRLCGAIGGGAPSPTEPISAQNNQWYRACSSGGINQFPYSEATEDAKACNGYTYWSTDNQRTTVEVGSLSGCQSSVPGYEGVFDLTGNVEEWLDFSSNAYQEYIVDGCLLKGADFASQTTPDCAPSGSFLGRRDFSGAAGFRCCTR